MPKNFISCLYQGENDSYDSKMLLQFEKLYNVEWIADEVVPTLQLWDMKLSATKKKVW